MPDISTLRKCVLAPVMRVACGCAPEEFSEPYYFHIFFASKGEPYALVEYIDSHNKGMVNSVEANRIKFID